VITVDTSALMAILLDEAEAEACIAALITADRLLISAGTVAETLIVAGRRNVGEEAAKLVTGMGFEVVPVTVATAKDIAEAYAQWGKGVHPAALNFGDCFAYQLARQNRCRLLYVGNDFAMTDVEAVGR
jgi:ribonuclease VapC